MTAQTYQRRANVTYNGYSDQGKCTIEVVVDGAAEVEVREANGVLRNLSGQPPQWRRFECSGVMPSNPANFRFAGVDGRGRQYLVRDPRSGGPAVIRIEDPGGGTEAYTFDITWSGGSGGGYVPDQSSGRYGTSDRTYRDRQFPTQEAIRVCQDDVRQHAEQRFNTNNVVFESTRMDDNPGRDDWVVGTFLARRGFGREERHRFSCSVNFDNGRVRSAQIDGVNVGRYGYSNRSYRDGYGGSYSSRQAMQSCERAVTQRMRRDGYDYVDFPSVSVDPRFGSGERIVGTAQADRGFGSEYFNFSCAVDPDNGSMRSLDVRRR